jgi:hypothetical protein
VCTSNCFGSNNKACLEYCQGTNSPKCVQNCRSSAPAYASLTAGEFRAPGLFAAVAVVEARIAATPPTVLQYVAAFT